MVNADLKSSYQISSQAKSSSVEYLGQVMVNLHGFSIVYGMLSSAYIFHLSGTVDNSASINDLWQG